MSKNPCTFKGRFILCFTAILICFFLTGAVLYKTTDWIQSRMSRIVGIYDQASGVRALVGDLVSSYRYYAISGNLDEQAILLKTISELEEEANGLQAEVSDICYVRNIEDLGNMVSTILSQTREALAHHNTGTGKSAIEYYEELTYTEGLIDNFYDYVYRSIRQLSAYEQARINGEKRLMYVALFLNLIVVAGTIAVMLRWLDKMARLSANMQLELERKQQKLEKADMEKLLRDSQIMALQARINPHFMFNTLNIVAQMAYVEGAEQTEQMIGAISDYYRYNLKDIHYISSFRDEVKNIDDYIYIQHMRFGERIHFETHYDETILSGQIPALVLQPLVENAIVHGLGACMEDGQIYIGLSKVEYGERESGLCRDNLCRDNLGQEEEGQRQDEQSPERQSQEGQSQEEKRQEKQESEGQYTENQYYVKIEIRDNGCGISEEKLIAIREMFEGQDTGHLLQSDSIGLQNVIRRLKAFYGDRIVLGVESVPGEGTRFTFCVPLMTNAEELSDYV